MKKEYSYDELYPGRFLKAEDFKKKDATLTIRDLDLEELEDKKGKKFKCILWFAETKKQLVLVKTNAECVKGMFGPKPKAWIGKRITFFPEPGTYFGRRQEAIRVRGSPDIEKDMQITCKVGRDDPFDVVMKKTGVKPAAGKAPAPAQPVTAADPVQPEQLEDIPPGVDDSGAPWTDGDEQPEEQS